MALVIKKTVDLSSLGDEYNGVQLVFNVISAVESAGFQDKQKELGDDNVKNINFMVSVLQDHFISGSHQEEALTKEDISVLETEALVHAFRILTGQEIDPKPENESTSTSSTKMDSLTK